MVIESPIERERRICEALRPEWERMAAQRRAADEREKERLAELWDGIEVGDFVELTPEEHVQRGGLMLVDEKGEMVVQQVRIVEIKGEMANVSFAQKYAGREWIHRQQIRGVVKPGLVGPRRDAAPKIWWG